MKRVIVLLFGCVPFLIGGLLHWGITTVLPNVGFPYLVFGILFLALWSLAAYALCKNVKKPLETLILFNLPAFIVLVLIIVQEVILGSYWSNFIGMMVQVFYLPVINIVSRLVVLVLRKITMTPIYSISFVMMAGVASLGCWLSRKNA